MPTNLVSAPDHPCKVLVEHYNDHRALQPETLPGVTGAPTLADPVTVQDTVNVLRKHEQARGVVFTALDTDALQAVYEAYAAFDGEGQKHAVDRIALSAEFQRAVRDLLGLDD